MLSPTVQSPNQPSALASTASIFLHSVIRSPTVKALGDPSKPKKQQQKSPEQHLSLQIESANEFVPRVTKSVVDSENPDAYTIDFASFADSDTLLCTFDGSLRISLNNGESWKIVEGFWGAQFVDLDEFHKERAFVLSSGGRVHVTEDQGRSWREFHFPRVPGKKIRAYSDVSTHPFDRNLLLVRCSVSPSTDIIYASDDAGRSFRRLAPPVSEDAATPFQDNYNCQFANSSKESTLEDNGVYCIYEADYMVDYDISQDDEGCKSKWKSTATVFYTPDLGETIKVFDELKDLLTEEIFIFPSNIFLLTSKAEVAHRWDDPKRLWISKSGRFEPLDLPDEVISLKHASSHHQNDGQERLLLTVVSGHEDHMVGKTLVLDPSTLDFSWLRTSTSQFDDEYDSPVNSAQFRQLGNLKGTLWGRFPTSIKENVSWLQRVINFPKNFFSKETPPESIIPRAFVTKASFDNGRTWTKLRVVDPSGKHRHLFKGDIDDVEHCSFQEIPYGGFGHRRDNEPTPGIILKKGTTGEHSVASDDDAMTFISRDGGASWEVLFETPVCAVFLDFGNIIIAIPKEKSRIYTKFLFSLNQGRTWNEYCFDEPITSNFVEISTDSSGLKVVMNFEEQEEESPSPKYVFLSADFSSLFEGAACTGDDLERWYLYGGKCIDGVRYSFYRRKPDAKGLMRKTFEKLELHEEKCEC